VDADEVLANAVKAVESALQRWPEQYRRMRRWRERLDEPMQNEERQRDDFYAFFVAAYHLSDWIGGDTTVADDVRRIVWDYRKTGALGLAGDVANGFKHMERRQGAENYDRAAHVSAIPDAFQLDMMQLDTAQLGTFVIAGDQTWEDALEIADRCIASWDAFLREHGLRAE
jgi:hypothetical protein